MKAPPPTSRPRVAVIGAGPAGLACAYGLTAAGAEVEVFEASDGVGGLARTIELWGQRADLGPHRFFSSDPRVNRLWLEVVGRDYAMVPRLTRIHYEGRFFQYPLRPFDALANLGVAEATACLASYAREAVRPRRADEASFEDWIVHRFGRRLFEIFFKSYSEKLWGISCDELDADFAAQRIRSLSLSGAIADAFFARGRKRLRTLCDEFAYPLGGTGVVYERMAAAVRARGGVVHLRTPVARVATAGRRVAGVELADGVFRSFDHVVSSMPITLLVRALADAPTEVLAAADGLTFRNTILVYLDVEATDLFPDNWLYVHSPKIGTGRITNFRNWVPSLHGAAKSSILSLEYWCSDEDPIWSRDESELVRLASSDLQATGLAGAARIREGHVHRIRRCYPVYRRGYRDHVKAIEAHVRAIEGLSVIGRYGAFKYNNQDHSLLMGILAAENVVGGAEHDLWAVNAASDDYQEACAITRTGLERIADRSSRVAAGGDVKAESGFQIA